MTGPRPPVRRRRAAGGGKEEPGGCRGFGAPPGFLPRSVAPGRAEGEASGPAASPGGDFGGLEGERPAAGGVFWG